ncbi:argininosuccinate lyase [Fictibacillus macauensis ZFHKF-1]|uniref:Argininosuccinate lyase n=1 Tax=Fictibacillus macauensis ZFHKF-1 TaxID=1196324 RepID=I8UKE9_9BACL|nr:argininosuccinate lyase [Fictibacillus macauensis ZFHKF-1]
MSDDAFIQDEGTTFPGKTYREELLSHVFSLQRDYLLQAMLTVHQAHVIMLEETGIIVTKEAAAMLQGLASIQQLEGSQFCYDPAFEDLFFLIDHKLAEEIGSDTAGNLHIGRSRNDLGVTMYRIVLRDHLLQLVTEIVRLKEALWMQAKKHVDTVMTAYTHTQPAQPTTFGHYVTAIYDVLERDLNRVKAAYHTVNSSPLGAAALATTSFPINRERTCALLGFEALVENSYDAIAGADYLVETATALQSLMINIGRWVQDFLCFVTRERGAITVADPYVQISSIMPQKRNPVSLEHARSLASGAVGAAQTVLQMIHNTPFGDIVDTEDDLQPYLYDSFSKATRVLRLLTAVIRTMTVNKATLANSAKEACITITELADILTANDHVPLRQAHAAASLVAKHCTMQKKELADLQVSEVNTLLSAYLPKGITAAQWETICSPAHFIFRRTVRGGPHPQEVERMLKTREEQHKHQQQWLQTEQQRLKTAAAVRQAAANRLVTP